MATLGSGNNNINIDGAETSFIDFGGNDTYTIIPSLSANVTITDNQASTINLPAGMDISAANFSANGVQFTVNGFTVTFIGNPSLFTFVFGGDPVFGGGTPKTFTETAVAFGTTVPAPGDAPNAATQTGPVDAGGTVGQTLVLTASANSVDEGASVDVSVTGAAANSTVAYTITGTGVDAADVNSLTGTITTDANGAGTASIAVTADNATEGEETMTVTLDGTTVSTDIKVNDTSVTPPLFALAEAKDLVNEGDANTFTVTLTQAAASDTTVTFQLAPGDGTSADQGTNTTNLNDFGTGAFNPVTAVIKAGDTTATFDVTALVDGKTELPETYTVTATVNGVSLSETSTVLDGAGGGVGQTFTLTENTDTLVGTANDDVFNAPVIAVGGVANQPTLNPLDNIDGGNGTDTLIVENNTVNPTTVQGTLSNIENLTMLGAGNVNNGAALNVSPFSGTVELQQTNDLAVNLTNVSGQTIAADRVVDNTVVDTDSTASATSIGLKSEGPLGDSTFNVDGAGLTDVSLSVDGTLAGKSVAIDNQDGGGVAIANDNTVKNVSIAASGNSTVNFDGTSLETVAITGKGTTAFTSTTAASKSIDASGSEGGATIGTAMANGAMFTGGTGKDTITVGATTKAHDMGDGDDTVNVSVLFGVGGSVDGGAGMGDILAMSSTNAAVLSANGIFETTVSNFEKVSIGQTAGGATDTVNMANLDDISMVKSAGTAAATGTAEVQTYTVNSPADANGGNLTFGGVQFSIANGASTNAIAAQIAGQQAALQAQNANIASVNAVGNQVVVTYNQFAADQAEFANVVAGGGNAGQGSSTVAFSAVTQNNGTTEVTEVQTLTVGTAPNTTAQATVTVLGTVVPVTLVAGQTTAQAASAIQAAIAGAGIANVTASVATNVVTLTYNSAAGNAAEVTFAAGTTGATAVAATPTPYVGPVAETQTFTITSGADADGGSVLIGGVRVEIAANANVDTVGTTIVNNAAAIIAANPTIAGLAYDTATDTVTVTYTAAAGNVAADITLADNNDTGVGITGVQTTAGVAGTPGGILNLTNVGTGGTLELTGAINGASSVAVKDAATNAADTFTVAFNGASNIVNTAALTVANVETINVTTADTNTAADPTVASSLNLAATAATTVNVSGNHGVNFGGSTLGAVTTLDASGVTATGAAGAVTFSTSSTNLSVTLTGGAGNDVLSGASTTDATKVVTINGGAGNDQITGGAGKDVLSGGDGNDVITGGANGDTLSGGAGNDIFDLNAIAESVLANRDVISDFSANTFGNGTAGAAGTGAVIASQGNFTGDLIDVRGLVTVGASAVDVSVQANAADAQTFIQNQAGGANGIGAALDSSTGLLYMDLVGNDGVIDSVVELTGVTTIDAAAFLVG